MIHRAIRSMSACTATAAAAAATFAGESQETVGLMGRGANEENRTSWAYRRTIQVMLCRCATALQQLCDIWRRSSHSWCWHDDKAHRRRPHSPMMLTMTSWPRTRSMYVHCTLYFSDRIRRSLFGRWSDCVCVIFFLNFKP